MLKAKHLQEWLESQVDESLIRLNVTSLDGYDPHEYLLYGLPLTDRRNDGRLRDQWLRRYAHTEAGAWWCGTVDSLWGCCKPDQPRQSDDDGKIKVIKYEHPPKVGTEIFKLRVSWRTGLKIAKRHGYGEAYQQRLEEARGEFQGFSGSALADKEDTVFWEWVKETNLPLTITEGAKKAGSLLSAGLVAIALPGIFNGYRKHKSKPTVKELIPQLQEFCTEGREINICFDQDIKPQTQEHVNTATHTLGKLFEKHNCTVKVITWDYPQKGVDDLITAYGVDTFYRVYEHRQSLPTWSQSQPEWLLNQALKRFGRTVKSGIKQAKKKLNAWGFGTEEVKAYQKQQQQPKEYAPGKRLEVWQNTGKFVLDSSDTGLGKSYDAGRFDLDPIDCTRAIYITADPRNVTTPTLKSWTVLQGRHNGLYRDSLGKIRTTETGELVESPNCGRTKTIHSVMSLGVNNAHDSKLICAGCPWYEACQGNHVYGYLGNRREALGQSRLVAHPGSLPNAEEFEDYRTSVLIWEESQTIFKNIQEVQVSQKDLDQLTSHILIEAPELLSQLQSILTALGKLFKAEKFPKFGYNHQQLLARFPALGELDLEAITKATQFDPNLLDPYQAEYGVSLEDLPAGMRKKLSDKDEVTAQKVLEEGLKQWLISLLEVLQGKGGYLSMVKGSLTITTPDQRLVEIAQAAKRNFFLDATGQEQELAQLLGIRVNEIDHVAQEKGESADLEIIQVAGLGRLGQQRGNHQLRQVEAIINKVKEDDPDTAVIRFKKYAEEGDGRWFIESRGCNDWERANTLILDGIPCANLNALAAEFTCIYGRPPAEGTDKFKFPVDVTLSQELPKDIVPFFEMTASVDPEFRAFVHGRVMAEIKQGIGRLRANRRPGEELTIYILGDFPLDIPVQLVKAAEITPEAGSKVEIFTQALRKAIATLDAEGKKITQTALAQITGYSQGYISRFRQLLLLLLDELNSKSNNSDPPDEVVEKIAKTYLPLVTEKHFLAEFCDILANFPERYCLRIFNHAPPEVKARILELLLPVLSESEGQRLQAGMGG
jgi:hypothetical protein